jgi:mRNA interferase MazF
MVIQRGDIVWVDFGVPRGSAPAKIRPSVVVQDDWLLSTTINTVIVAPMTTNARWESLPGNVRVPREASGLPEDSVVNVSQVGSVSREFVDPFPAGHLPRHLMARVDEGVRLVMGL